MRSVIIEFGRSNSFDERDFRALRLGPVCIWYSRQSIIALLAQNKRALLRYERSLASARDALAAALRGLGVRR